MFLNYHIISAHKLTVLCLKHPALSAYCLFSYFSDPSLLHTLSPLCFYCSAVLLYPLFQEQSNQMVTFFFSKPWIHNRYKSYCPSMQVLLPILSTLSI